jgi:hypothetical protein
MIHYLKKVIEDHFTRVYLACYARPAEHADLEKYLKKTKAGTNLTASHLSKIFSDGSWNFSITWGMPTEDQIQNLAEEIKEDLKFVCNHSPVVDAEDRLLTAMVKTINNIEIVSVCLSFIMPERYCIMAPPPEHMIGFRRTSDKVKTLKRYFAQMRGLGDHYGLGAFEIEKALWTIHQLKYRIPDYDPSLTEELWSAYKTDPNILRLRVGNLLDEIWGENISDDLKANILKEKDPEVALILAMRYFEQSLWVSVSKTVDSSKLDEIKASTKKGNILIKLLEAANAEPYLMKKAQRIWRKRNDAMHGVHDSAEPSVSTSDVVEAIELNKLMFLRR